MPRPTPAEKPCAVCGRTITWRKKWARDWDAVRYCSDACRRAGVRPLDTALEDAVLRLLAALPAGATTSPSDAADAVAQPSREAADLREPARAAARRLAARGEVEILHQGRVVADASRARGPILVRRRRAG